MGLTEVELQIKNPYRLQKTAKGRFLVDSGASYTVLTQKMVEQLGIKPTDEREFVLADGTSIKRKLGNALITFKGVETATPVVLGEKGDTPLLGVITLEGMGYVLNPFERKLHPARLLL